MGNCCGGKKQPGDQEPKRKTTIETKDPKDDEENLGLTAKVEEEEHMEAPEEQDTPEDYGEENDSNYKPSSEEYDTPDDEAPTPPPESVADLGAEFSKNFSGKVISSAEARLAREWNQNASRGEYDKLNYR